MDDFAIFGGALAVAYLIPGPDMLLILETSALQGRARALATAAGLALARGVHVALAALGLATLLRTAPFAFEVARLLGAGYLVYLGIVILRARSKATDMGIVQRDRSGSALSAAMRGLLTNLLNPKALLFCSVLLPQFVRPAQGSVAESFLKLGVILVGMGFVFDVFYAETGSALGRWLARRPMIQAVQGWTFAALLIGFGLHLAFSRRPS